MYDPNSDYNKYYLSQQQYVKNNFPGRPPSGHLGASNLAQGGQQTNPYISQNPAKDSFISINNRNSASYGPNGYPHGANQYAGNQYASHQYTSNSQVSDSQGYSQQGGIAQNYGPQAGSSYAIEPQIDGPQGGGIEHQAQLGSRHSSGFHVANSQAVNLQLYDSQFGSSQFSNPQFGNPQFGNPQFSSLRPGSSRDDGTHTSNPHSSGKQAGSEHCDREDSGEESSDNYNHHDNPHYHKYRYFPGNPYYIGNPYMDPRLLGHPFYAGKYHNRSSSHSNSSRERRKDEASIPLMMKYPLVYHPDKKLYLPHVSRDRIVPEVHGKTVKHSHHNTTQMHGRRYYVPVFQYYAPATHHNMSEMHTFNKRNETEDTSDSQDTASQNRPSSSQSGPTSARTTESRDSNNNHISKDHSIMESSDVGSRGPRFNAASNVSSNLSSTVRSSVPLAVKENVTKDASSSSRSSSRDPSIKPSSALQSNTGDSELPKINASIDIIEKVLSEPHAKEGMRVTDIQLHLIKHHPACSFLGQSSFTNTILRILNTDPRFYAVKQSNTEGKYWGVHRSLNRDKPYSSALPVRSFKDLSSRLEALQISSTKIVEIPEFDHAEEELTAKDLLYGAFLARPHPITLVAEEVYELILLLYPNQRFVHIKAKLAWLLKTSSNFSGVLTPQNTMSYILNDDFLKVHGARKHFLQEYLKERLLKTDYKVLYRFSFLFRETLNPSTVASAAHVECNQVYMPAVETTKIDKVALAPAPDKEVGPSVSGTTNNVPENKPTGDTTIEEPNVKERGPSNDQLPSEEHLNADVGDKSNTAKTPFQEVSLSDQNKGDSDRQENNSEKMDHEEATDRDAVSESAGQKSTQTVVPVIPGPVMPIVDQSSDSDKDNSGSVSFIPEMVSNFRLSGFTMVTGLFLALPRGKALTKEQVCEGVAFLYSARYRPPTIYSILYYHDCFKKGITLQRTPTYTLDDVYAAQRHARSTYLKERMVTLLKSKNTNIKSIEGLYETLDEVLGPQYNERKANSTLNCNSISAMSDFVARMMRGSPSGEVTTVEILDKILKQFPRYRNYAYSTMQAKIHAVLKCGKFAKVLHGPATYWTLRDKFPAELKQAELKQTEAKQTEAKQAGVKQTDQKQAEPEQTEAKQAGVKQTEPKQTEPKQMDLDQQRIKVSLFVESDNDDGEDNEAKH